MEIKVNKILYDTTAEGFGHRACIWVQGCHRHCPGCMSQHTWDPAGGFSIEINAIVSEIMKRSNLEGITLLGGEPFEQAKGLGQIAKACRAEGMSVIAFSGYTLQELCADDSGDIQNLLKQIDLLIDGPYQKELRDFDRPLVGSTNQQFCFLTDRYSMQDVKKLSNRVEIRISKDGGILINGMSDFERTLN